MNKLFLLKLSLFALLLACFGQSKAQNIALMEPRLLVNSPSSIAGGKTMTYSSQNTGGWGRALDSFWYNQPLVIVDATDTIGCVTASSAVNGKWALIWRGNCEFGAKAAKAQAAGAKGVIIIQNLPGEPAVGMGAGAQGSGVTIPVLMVSYNDGLAMYNQLKASQPVFISLTNWGFGFTNDLAIVPNSSTLPPNFAIPVTQINSSAGHQSLRAYTGAFVANVGTATQNNVKLKTTVDFTPLGGSATNVYTDSVVATNPLTVSDSIIEMFTTGSHNLSFTQQGRLDFKNEVTFGNGDDQATDNTANYTLYVTPHVFSKGRYDMVKQKPLFNIGYKRSTAAPLTWGPLYYVTNGGYKADKVQVAVSDGSTDTTHTLEGQAINVLLYEWVDGSNGGVSDNLMQGNELSLKGAASKTFTNMDSNYTVSTMFFKDLPGTGNVSVKSNTWYWVAVDLGSNFYLACDGEVNYFTRSYAASNTTPPTWDYWAPSYFEAYNNIPATDTLNMFPFANKAFAKDLDTVSFTGQKGVVPAVPFYLGVFPDNVNNTVSAQAFNMNVYPNPAVEVINAEFSLTQKSTAFVTIIDNMGRGLIKQKYTGIQNEKVTIPVSSLPAGNYHIIVNINDKTVVKPFSVIK